MNMDIYDLLYGLNDVSDYLVIETEKKNSLIKERLAIKWASLAASVCLVVAAALYSVYMNGGFGYFVPADTQGDDTSVTDTGDTTDTSTVTEETNDAVDTDKTTDTDSEEKDPEQNTETSPVQKVEAGPSALTGDLTEYSFDYDKLEKLLLPIEKAEGNYVDGMQLSVSVQPKTYENGTVIAFVKFEKAVRTATGGLMYIAEGDFIYAVRISLDRDDYEYVNKFYYMDDAYNEYGLPYLQSIYPYGYFEFSESDKYLLYRDKDTANLKLHDKTTDNVVTIHEWNNPDDGAARGFGIGDGGILCADKYVFFTLVTPDYEFYLELYSSINDYIYDPSADHAIMKTNYVYDIEIGELREFMNGYTFCGVGGNILYLCTESEAAGGTIRYYSVDLSGGLNENLRDEEFLNEVGSNEVQNMLSDDGRYILYMKRSNGQITFYSYDTVTKKIKTAVATNELQYSAVTDFIVTSDGKFVISCWIVTDTRMGDIGDERIIIFDFTSE